MGQGGGGEGGINPLPFVVIRDNLITVLILCRSVGFKLTSWGGGGGAGL